MAKSKIKKRIKIHKQKISPEMKTSCISCEDSIKNNIPLIKNKKRQFIRDNPELLSKELNEKDSLFSILKKIYFTGLIVEIDIINIKVKKLIPSRIKFNFPIPNKSLNW
ncbi:hypothetical protein [Snodgrassella alvi]|uniref:hypothetical protein n=1 Tax=Snodgrassella alvi TaxID=1196083 RepID=UPI002740757C|nr:hypothetical protein [Snodgrassella alvi]WLT01876.1 hypothetical protein RAM00_08450 [Snodgrassella alvi]